MRVLHVIQRYWPYVGGSERYFQEISERLARDGHEVHLYTTDAWDIEHYWARGKKTVAVTEEEHNGVYIKRFPVRHLPGSPWAYPVIRKLMSITSALPFDATPLLLAMSRYTPWVPGLDEELAATTLPFDLIHAANSPFDSLIYAAARLARRDNIPFIITPFTHLGEPQDAKVRQYYTMRHQIALLRDSTKVIVQTELERDWLLHKGVPADKMVKIGVGVNPVELRGGDAARFRNKYEITASIVAYIGTTAYDKGTHHLVQAMVRLWERGVDAKLVLAGPTMEHFTNFLSRQPPEVRDKVHLLGFISEQDKLDLLAACKLLVMPSRTDSFGIVYLEAWLYDKPVIGARAGGVPEVIDEGQNGYLVKFGDVATLVNYIAELLQDKETARRFGQRGHEKVLERYTWDKIYAKISKLYEGITIHPPR